MGDLFAPAWRAGDPAAMQAVNDWQNRVFNVNDQNIEQTRMPVSFNTGNPAGELDPEALRVRAMGGPYDFDARRNAVAAAVAQQQAAAAATQAQVTGGGSGVGGAFGGGLGGSSGGPYSGGGPVAAGLTPPQVMLGVS
jgi:hypothetical protein